MPNKRSNPRSGRCSGAPGWSLIEALVVLALLALLLGLAVPGVAGWRARHEQQAVAEDVWNSLMLARSQALQRQQRVVLCPLALAGGCDPQGQWQQGWLVFVDDNHNGVRDEAERLLQLRAALPMGLRLQGNSTVGQGVRYGPDGRIAGLGGSFSLCRAGGAQGGGAEGWRVVINALGRPRLEKSETLDCP